MVATFGSLGGVLLAVFYGKGILELLGGKWSGAVSGASFAYEPSAVSMFAGLFGAVVIAFLAMSSATS